MANGLWPIAGMQNKDKIASARLIRYSLSAPIACHQLYAIRYQFRLPPKYAPRFTNDDLLKRSRR